MLGFRVRLGPGYIYRLYMHDLPHVPPSLYVTFRQGRHHSYDIAFLNINVVPMQFAGLRYLKIKPA